MWMQIAVYLGYKIAYMENYEDCFKPVGCGAGFCKMTLKQEQIGI
jgi:hypothetical protein